MARLDRFPAPFIVFSLLFIVLNALVLDSRDTNFDGLSRRDSFIAVRQRSAALSSRSAHRATQRLQRRMRFLTEAERNPDDEQQRRAPEAQGPSHLGTPRQSLDLVHHPPEEAGTSRGGLRRTESDLERATKVQTLHFPELPRREQPHGHTDAKRHHTFRFNLPGTDTATLVLGGRTAWVVVDVLHLREERDAKFLDKLRTLHTVSTTGGASSEGSRRVYHIEPAGMDAAVLERILGQRRREVQRAFGDRVQFHQYRKEKVLTVDDRDWAMTHSLTVKLNGMRLHGESMSTSFSRLTIT